MATDITLEVALGLLSLPREIGIHPETNQMITAGIGRYGPYLRHQNKYASLSVEEDILSLGLNRAVTILAEAKSSNSRELGSHPKDGKPILVQMGRYGPYVRHGQTNATLPKETEMHDLTLEKALELITAKLTKSGIKKAKSTTRKKSPAKSKLNTHT